MLKPGKCDSCGISSFYHIQTWLDECMSMILPSTPLPHTLLSFADTLFEKAFLSLGILKEEEEIDLSSIQKRSALFITEARNRGVRVVGLRGRYGYTNQFRVEFEDIVVRFEGFPLAEHISSRLFDPDCKQETREFLQDGGFLVVEGLSFSLLQRDGAMRYGEKLGYPLVVKPRRGSVAQHVTTDIRSRDSFVGAIRHVLEYSPRFIVERYVENSFVYRATVIDYDFVACVKQVPAHVVGDSSSSIRDLVVEKNRTRDDGGDFFHSLVVDETTKRLLGELGYTLSSVPENGERVYLQRDPFMRLGGDLEEVTGEMHGDNRRLFQDVAEYTGMRVVGIDICIPDISISWKKQECAILELNSLPSIEMHHTPSSGESQDVAGALVDLLFKYYS